MSESPQLSPELNQGFQRAFELAKARGDLRILDETDAEAPYQIEPDVEYREERIRHTGEVEIISLREEGNSIEVRVRLPKDSPDAEGFTFFTPQRDYERNGQHQRIERIHAGIVAAHQSRHPERNGVREGLTLLRGCHRRQRNLLVQAGCGLWQWQCRRRRRLRLEEPTTDDCDPQRDQT